MLRLKSRNVKPLPGGLRFLQPQIPRWSIVPWSSFESAVDQIIAVRKANPLITANNGLSLDPATVAEELDSYNAKICQEMGWKDYIYDGPVGSDPPPKLQSLQSALSQSGALAAGVKTLAEWEITGGVLVPQELAEQRALNCSTCPKNGSGDLAKWFTVPAAALIQKQLEARNNLKIHTTRDPLLGICEACACPLPLKIHCPLDIITKHMRPQEREQLHPNCWITNETKNDSHKGDNLVPNQS